MVQIGKLSWLVQVEQAADAKQQAEEVGEKVEQTKKQMEGADEKTEGLNERMESLEAVQEGVGRGMDKMNAKAGFVGTALSFVVGMVTSLIGVLTSLTALVVAGGLIAGLVALATAWKHNLGDIRGKTGEFVEWLKEVTAEAGNYLSDALGVGIEAVRNAWAKHGDGIMEKASEMWAVLQRALSGFLNWFMPKWSKFTQDLLALWEIHAGPLADEFIETLDVMMARLQFFVGVAEVIWAEWGDTLMAVADFAWTLISVTILQALDAILTGARVILMLLQGDFSGAFEAILGFVSRTMGRMGDVVGSALNLILTFWGDYVRNVKEFWIGLKDWIVDFAKGVGRAVASALKGAFNAAIPDSVGIDPVTVKGKTVFPGKSIDLPQLNTGGVIKESGIAEVHEGEAVIPADITRAAERGGDSHETKNVEIHVGGVEIGDQSLDISDMSPMELRALAETIAEQLGDDVRSVIT